VYTAAERATRFTAAERALTANNLAEARRIYSELLAVQGLDRDSYIRVAEGFYRARDFARALAAFERAGGLRGGEEPYRYYIAVALYETGQYERAKRELASALPYIEITPDVARYRTKIQSAVQ
jgi:tetratricopeptide (TPR) repeat protein